MVEPAECGLCVELCALIFKFFLLLPQKTLIKNSVMKFRLDDCA